MSKILFGIAKMYEYEYEIFIAQISQRYIEVHAKMYGGSIHC